MLSDREEAALPSEGIQALRRTPLLADKLAGQLRREIVGGRYTPGRKLPTERELSETYGVSRAIVREAMGRLKQDGLVVSRQGAGAFVGDIIAPVFRLDMANGYDFQDIKNIIELLSAVVSAASGLAAIRRTPAQLALIRRHCEAMDEVIAQGRSGVEEDMAFHRAIIEAAGNPLFADILDFLDSRVRAYVGTARANSARFKDLTRQVQEEHRIILAAITAEDEDGARIAAATHLANAVMRLSRGMAA
ncbi:MAG: FadR family transcriptional regulator [Acidisphaera sp.]|nr:FadR family transcriptional regulator [Acidisphaera sp.]